MPNSINNKGTSRRQNVIVGGFVVVLAGLLIWLGLSSKFDQGNWPSEFKSNGERIYFTATSSSGGAVVVRGGGMRMGMMSGGGGCVSCHGVRRQGKRLTPRFWISAPPLTAKALFGEHDEDGHGGHDSYTIDTLRRAVTEGIDAGGKPLDPAMPRWSMSGEDFNDLAVFLKSN